MEESCLVDVDEKDGVVDLDQIWRDEYFKVRIDFVFQVMYI